MDYEKSYLFFSVHVLFWSSMVLAGGANWGLGWAHSWQPVAEWLQNLSTFCTVPFAEIGLQQILRVGL